MNEIYKFNNGAIVEVLSGSFEGDAVNVSEFSEEIGVEKHLPVVIDEGGEIIVKIGEVPHPMEPEHYIEWIEVITDDGLLRKYLKPGMKPEARFPKPEGRFYVREHCNLHGLWAKK